MNKWYKDSCTSNLCGLCSGVLLSFAVIQSTYAEHSSPDNSLIDISQSQISNTQWSNWLISQVETLPSIKAQDAEITKSKELQNAQSQPLYNPELSVSYTQKDDQEIGVALTQTIDWFDKKQMNSKLGQTNYELSVLEKKIEIESILAQALYAYLGYSKEHQLLTISKKQERLLNEFSDDLKKREALGDVGAMDAEMAYLSLTQNLQQTSLVEIRHRQALSVLAETLNTHSIPYVPESSVWNNPLNQSEISQLVNRGFKTQLAEKQLHHSENLSQISQLDRKNNPTFGIGLGREGSENSLSLDFSIPLNIHNTYVHEYKASLQQVVKSELELEEQKRVADKQIKQAYENYLELKSRVAKWEKLTTKRVKGSEKILTRLWQSGDLATSDYLFSLQQRTESLISNVELSYQMQKAWIDWLLVTTQVKSWLKQLQN